MDLDRLYHLMIALSLVGLGMVILSLVGEHLDWGNDLGEVLLSLGGLLSVLTAVVAMVLGSTRGQVREVGAAVLDNNAKLDSANGKLDGANAHLGTIDVKRQRSDKLDQLGAIHGKLDKLDVIQLELDRQTGVLDRQVAILGEIRDTLRGDAV